MSKSTTRTTSLDNDPDYQAAVLALKRLQDSIAQWPQFGADLQTLQQSLSKAAEGIIPDRMLPPREEEPLCFESAYHLLQGTRLSLDQVADRQGAVIATNGIITYWITGNQQAKAATSTWLRLSQQKLSSALQASLQEAKTHLITVWDHLWLGDADTIKNLTAEGGDLDQANIIIAQINEELGTGHRMFAASHLLLTHDDLPPESFIAPGAINKLRASDSRRPELFSRAVRLGDKGAALLAFIIAVLTGLSAKYFGQPFGTIEDYLGLFLWAVGTKAAVDILTSVIGRFSSQVLTQNS